MATHAVSKYSIEPFWDDEFKGLNYIHEPFNNSADVQRWRDLGFSDRFVGDMCDMRQPQPSWNHKFVEFYQAQGWQHIGTSY